MYYCKKCGSQLSDDSQFCSECGAKQDRISSKSYRQSATNVVPRSSTLPNQVYANNTNKLLFRAGYSNKMLTLYIFTVIVNLIITIIVNIVFRTRLSSTLQEHYTAYRESAEVQSAVSNAQAILFFYTVIMIIVIAELIIKCFQVKSNYLHITEEGVYGEACPSFGFGTLDFRFTFSQIRSVTLKYGRIILRTRSDNKKYICCVENAAKAKYIINDKLFG